jgi:hypothetical protein
MKYFPAKVSRNFLIFTYIVNVLLVGITFVAGVSVSYQNIFFGILLSVLGLLIILVTRAFVANGFEITDQELIIRRWARSIHIPLNQIKEIRNEDPVSILKGKMTLRLFADGGLWGAHGIFYNKNIGKFYMYMTDEKNLVDVVRADGRHFFISPDPREQFVQELKSRITQ